MSNLEEVKAKNFTCNPFHSIGKEWMLITAEKAGKANTMTASWGGLGVMWHYDVAYIFIRESRFTKEFVDDSDTFSLSFLDPKKYRKEQNYLGTVSGRDEDKITKSGLTLEHDEGIPYFAESDMVMLCRKLSKHPLSQEGMLDETILPKCYPDGNYHDMYVGEIKKILQKK